MEAAVREIFLTLGPQNRKTPLLGWPATRPCFGRPRASARAHWQGGCRRLSPKNKHDGGQPWGNLGDSGAPGRVNLSAVGARVPGGGGFGDDAGQDVDASADGLLR